MGRSSATASQKRLIFSHSMILFQTLPFYCDVVQHSILFQLSSSIGLAGKGSCLCVVGALNVNVRVGPSFLP